MSSLLRRCCGGAVCWLPDIVLPLQSVFVGEVGQCVGVRAVEGGCQHGCPRVFLQEQLKGIIITGPVAAGVRVYSSVGHL